MAIIGPSSLSILCQCVESFVKAGLRATNNDIDITVGAPSVAASATPKMNRVNLFFNRFEPSGYGANGHPGEPWLLRLHCLITAFGHDDSAENITAGEFELRMIGEVIRLFHETPVMESVDVFGEAVRLQSVYQPLNYETLNQLWSTQNETSYRPSVAYEFALGPIMPVAPKTVPKKVGSVGLVITPKADGGWETGPVEWRALPVGTRVIDIRSPHWSPAICFVVGSVCLSALQLDLDDIDLGAYTIDLWIAGDSSSSVKLKWLLWDITKGWLEQDPGVSASPVGNALRPEGDIPAGLIPVSIPLAPDFDGDEAQAQLFVERSYSYPAGEDPKTVRSNPLLITFIRSSAL